MDKINVLITAASRRGALVKNFSVLKGKLPFMGQTIAVDYNLLSPALYLADKFYKVPLINDKNYFTEIMKIVKKEDIKLVIPTIDIELPLWGNKRKALLKEGVFVAASPEKTAIICNDKFKAYDFFRKNGFPTPKTWSKGEITNIKEEEFPLFIKPAMGRGSVNTYKINNKKELDFFINYVKEPVIQQYIKGEEFTVDLIADFTGNVLSIVPRKRLLVRAGVSDRGVTFYNEKIIDDIKQMAEKLNIIGPANFQGFISNDKIHYIEINPRFSGGIQLTIAAGVNFQEILVRLVHGEKITPFIGEYIRDMYMTSYSESIFLHEGKPVK